MFIASEPQVHSDIENQNNQMQMELILNTMIWVSEHSDPAFATG